MSITINADNIKVSRTEITKWGAKRVGTVIVVPCKMPSAEFMAKIQEA